jgi:type II secretory pathway pseudopilin PulG
MKHSSGAEGFTIVETLIVLAVTGGMLLSAMLLISGRQDRTQFAQGIRTMQQQIQQVINEVSSGYYPNRGDFTCAKNGSGNIDITGAAQEQGSNRDCVFFGKTIQFAVDDPSGSPTNPEVYNVYTAAALREGSIGSVIDLDTAKPKLIANDGANGFPDRFETKNMPYGMKVYSMYYNNTPGKKIGAVTFASSLSNLDIEGSGQQVNVYAMKGTDLHRTKNNGVDKSNDAFNDTDLSESQGTLNPVQGIQICIQSGGTNQSGLLTIGGTGGPTTVDIAIKENTTCS